MTGARRARHGSRWRTLVRIVASRPTLVGAAAVGVVSAVLLGRFATTQPVTTRMLVAWDLAVTTFMVGTFSRTARSSPERIARHAAEEDQGRHTILALCLVAAVAAVAAIALELRTAKAFAGALKGGHVLFAFGTVALSWFFVHLIFAIHYAHEYYRPDEGEVSARKREGLRFPGEDPPDFWDFLHFALVIGVANQTADVAITAKPLRRLVTLHGLVAFVFNTVVLALSINFAAALLL
jgi:uncharacterized membrane protein